MYQSGCNFCFLLFLVVHSLWSATSCYLAHDVQEEKSPNIR